jgi:hypothetical protein
MDGFKVPTNLPQDLLLIHELVGQQEVQSSTITKSQIQPPRFLQSDDSDDIDTDSEDEVIACLIKKEDGS